MNESILTSVKKLLGITEDYTEFDIDIIVHINTVFTILNQLGVGPTKSFSISDKTSVWSDFLGDSDDLELVKSYVPLKVRLLFDPPTNGNAMEATKRMIEELEWRLFVTAEVATSTSYESSITKKIIDDIVDSRFED